MSQHLVKHIEFETAHIDALDGSTMLVQGRAYVSLEDVAGRRRIFRLSAGQRDAIIKIIDDMAYFSEVER